MIDEEALFSALEKGQIAGAGLDVFETEPLPSGSPFRKLDNVLLSPHVSGMDLMAEKLVTERCVQNILNFFAGEIKLIEPYVVNSQILTGMADGNQD